MTIPLILEKALYVAAVIVLCAQHRVPPDRIVTVASDVLLGLLFGIAFRKSPA
jgi:hypothetical protein